MSSYRKPALLKGIPRDRHAVIEANAGTGKTFAIEHLVLDLLLNTGCSIENILVVTFTEKATVELRGRIHNLIEEVLLGRAPTGSELEDDIVSICQSDKHKLEKALYAFDRAPIFTIHGFCRRILGDMAFDTGVAFDLEIVDARRAFHRGFRNELREVIAVDPVTKGLLDEWLSDGETAGYPNLVDSLEALLWEAQFNRYLQSDPSVRSRNAITELAETYDKTLLARLLAPKLARISVASLEAAEQLGSILDDGAGRSPRLYQTLSALRLDLLRPAAGNDPLKLRLVEAMETALVSCSLESRVVDSFLPLIANRLRNEKSRSNEIDYADMLERVWEALEGNQGEGLLASLRSRFRYGLVDEFQDTDDLQWKIFRRIFLESGTTNILYAVGDPKQAIYGFRGADVYTYLDARRQILGSGGAPVKLVENHRSSDDLIDALNRILDQSASPPLFSGEIRYDAPVQCGRRGLRVSTGEGRPVVPVTLLDYRPVNPPAAVARLRTSIGRWIAAEIKRILFEADAGVIVSDDKGNRRVEARDIFVLTRSGFEAVEIAGYLRERGVPFAFYKKDGLLQTPEAYDICDILRAIDAPDSQSKLLKALITPFFAVPYAALFDCEEVPADHPIIQRLYEWKALTAQNRFGELFDRLSHQSGLASRELFLSNNERELTNYQHIFEILLEEARSDGLSLRELIARLESFIAGTALPAGTDSNVQRIEGERSAVQIMSVHMSKGLQADIVFLFGGTAQPNVTSRVSVYHDAAGMRRMAIGKDARNLAKDALGREARAENQRLCYVALTRACVKLYLPVYRSETTKRAVNGYYEPLNSCLQPLLQEIDRGQAPSKLFQTAIIHDSRYDADRLSARLEEKIATWSPSRQRLGLLETRVPDNLFAELRARSSSLQLVSYTTLGRRAGTDLSASDLEAEEFKYDRDGSSANADLRGGRRIGIFLHEVIEKLDLKSFEANIDLRAWREISGVKRVFSEAMRRHQVTDRRWFDRGTEIVFNALTTRVAAGSSKIGPLYKCRSVREMEFVYPIPEHAHRLLRLEGNGKWTVERGYLKGIVDLVFKEGDIHYFVDWKSDSLSSYDPDFIKSHVGTHYELQARIYTVGIVRLLGIRNEVDYDRLFGGMLYLFIRGMQRNGTGKEGVYFRRPNWKELGDYEQALIDVISVSRQ